MRGGGNSEPLISKDCEGRKSGLRKKFFAFTLAEVLITLGIIGIVAALTMPSLISNHKKKVYVTQLKKTFSVLSQGLALAKVQDDVPEFKDTKLYNLLKQPHFSIETVENEAKKYFQIVKSCIGATCGLECSKSLNGGRGCSGPYIWPSDNIYSLYLNDGSVIGFISASSHYNGLIDIVVDINGEKLPNQYGRDIFRFAVDNNDKLVPWDDSGTGECYINGGEGDPCIDPKRDHGWCCAQRIMADGWQMNY